MKKYIISALLIFAFLFASGCERNTDENSQTSLENYEISYIPSNQIQYSDEVKFYNFSDVFNDEIVDFTYIGNDRIVMEGIKNSSSSDMSIYRTIYDIQKNEVLKVLNFDQGYTYKDCPDKYKNNGFSYVCNDYDDYSKIYYETYDNSGNLLDRFPVYENNSYSDYDIKQIGKIKSMEQFISCINNNGIIIKKENINIVSLNTKTNETKILLSDSDDGSFQYKAYWFIDENNFLFEKTKYVDSNRSVNKYFVYNISDDSYHMLKYGVEYNDIVIKEMVNNKIIGFSENYKNSSSTAEYVYHIKINDNYMATYEKIWTCETGVIIDYDYSDDEKTLAILSDKSTENSFLCAITLIDTDTYEVLFEKDFEIKIDEYSPNNYKFYLLSDGSISVKFYDKNTKSNEDRNLLLFLIEPKNS